MIKEKESDNGACVIDYWHNLFPLGEVIYNHYNVLMNAQIYGFTIHKINPPLEKVVDENYRV